MLSSSKYSKSKSSVLGTQVFDANAYATSSKPHSFSQQLSSDSSCSQQNGNVKFSGLFKEKIDDREKYLTAKYPNHQMALIKKRLKVEFWIDDKLKLLFQIKEENVKEDYEICPDDLVDTLLDIDEDEERASEIITQLSKVSSTKRKAPSKESVLTFVDELLVKLRML